MAPPRSLGLSEGPATLPMVARESWPAPGIHFCRLCRPVSGWEGRGQASSPPSLPGAWTAGPAISCLVNTGSEGARPVGRGPRNRGVRGKGGSPAEAAQGRERASPCPDRHILAEGPEYERYPWIYPPPALASSLPPLEVQASHVLTPTRAPLYWPTAPISSLYLPLSGCSCTPSPPAQKKCNSPDL